jgi:hypothetical protein
MISVSYLEEDSSLATFARATVSKVFGMTALLNSRESK